MSPYTVSILAAAAASAVTAYVALRTDFWVPRSEAALREAVAREKEGARQMREARVRLQIALGAAQAEIKKLKIEAESDSNHPSKMSERADREDSTRRTDSKGVVGISTVALATIGTVTTPYSTRNGTPRQPSLIPMARSRLVLHPHIPKESLRGVNEYSHVWIIFLFHQNTNFHKTQFKGTVRPPRLGEGATSLGVFATRTPHRPAPVGLSLARVSKCDLDTGTLYLEGLDLVNGTPVIDIKPYVAFSDTPNDDQYFSPSWVGKTNAAGNEPLEICDVLIADEAREALACAWGEARRRGHASPSLYDTAQEFVQFVLENLLLDFRSARERHDPKFEIYRVTLCEVVVRYKLSTGGPGENRIVTIIGADVVSEKTAQPIWNNVH